MRQTPSVGLVRTPARVGPPSPRRAAGRLARPVRPADRRADRQRARRRRASHRLHGSPTRDRPDRHRHVHHGAAATHETTAPPQPKALRRSFPAAGITKLVLRAGDADKAMVETGARGSAIEVSGIPTGGAAGYHSPDPKWRETPAAEWGLDFVSVQRGPILVVSTKNEMRVHPSPLRLRLGHRARAAGRRGRQGTADADR